MARALCLIAALTFLKEGSLARADTFTSITGASAPVENRQPTLTTRYMIAVQGIFPDNTGSDLSEQQPPSRFDAFIGEIKAIPFNFAPRGWMLCEGQALSTSQNPTLFSLLGFAYGGDGVNTFKLPDLRGRVPIGVGQGFGLPNYTLGQQVGTANPTLSVANLPSHTHILPGGGNTQPAGSGAALDNRQPSLGVQFLIAANGELMMAAFSVEPGGWTHCDGRVFPIAGHNYLYINIGNTYGGDGFSSFALPDPRGRVIVGDDNTNSWPIGKTYGGNDIVLGLSEVPAHTHTTSAGTTGSAGGAGNTANNYQPSLVLRQLLSLSGSFPTTDNGVSFPMLAEMRLIAGASATGLSAGQWPAMYNQLYNIQQNSTLFSLLGTNYGGNGSSTFAIPDLRARIDMGVDGTNAPIASILGQPALLISVSQLAAHAHALVTLSITGIQHSSVNGSALLTLQGTVGSSCQVEKSDTLPAAWSSLGQVNFGTATQTIPDSNSTHVTRRFYYAHIP